MKVDRRKRMRFKVKYPVIMKTAHGTFMGVVKNMNGKGALIHCRAPVLQSETFVLEVELPNGSSVELSAKVIWTRFPESKEELEMRGMGVRFIWEGRD